MAASIPSRTLFLLAFVPVVGCGRPKASIDDGDTSTTSSSSVAASESGEGSSESAGSSESDSESSGETGSTTTSFVPRTDFQPVSECDGYAHDCPEGQKCVPYGSTGGSWDANKCVPVLGDQKPGEPCHYSGTVESTDDCDATSFCWDVMDVDGEVIGTCAPLCTGSPDDPQCPDYPGCGDYSCLVSSDGSLNLCVANCDPFAQDCGAGLACYWWGNGFTCIFTTEDLAIGQPCDAINDCVAGTVCSAAELVPNCAGASCCAPFCDPTALDDPCPGLLAGTSCEIFSELSDDCSVGLCTAPP